MQNKIYPGSTDYEFQIRLCGCAGSVEYSLFSCGVGTAHVFGPFFFPQIANSRSGCGDAQAHVGIHFSHLAKVQLLCFGTLFLTDSKFQIRLRRSQAHVDIRCSHVAKVQLLCFGPFVSTDSEIQIGLQECAGSYGYYLFSCGVGIFFC